MPSVKIPRHATDYDMTPFVDVAFLILSFFMLATKFKPPEPVEVTTPNSVSSKELPDNDAVMITIDKDGKVLFSIFSENNPSVFDNIVQNINTTRNLGLTPAEMANFRKTVAVGVPYSKLKSLLAVPADDHKNVKQEGIPIDSANNELVYWIRDAKSAFAGRKLVYLIKGDSNAKFPSFKGVIDALRKNEEFKYNLVTQPEDAPVGTELYKIRKSS